MPSDNPHFRISTVRDRDGDRIITTIDLMDGPTMRRRMEQTIIDLQQDHLEEILNGMGYFRTKTEEVEH